MRNKLTFLATIVVAMSLADFAAAQQTPIEAVTAGQGRSNLEWVGPTMRRVSPVGRSPYEFWFQKNKDKMPTFEGLLIQDARTEPLEYWEDMGVDGLYIKLSLIHI